MSYLYVLLTVILTVYAQLVIKWQVSNAGNPPLDIFGKLLFIAHLLLNPWVLSAFFCAFLSAITWMAALTKLDLSHAYPFVGLTFVFIVIFSAVFFQEAITVPKIIGLALVVSGIVVGSQG